MITEGVVLAGAAAVAFSVAYRAVRSKRPPWWTGDTIMMVAVAPIILVTFVAGAVVTAHPFVTGNWRDLSNKDYAIAASIAGVVAVAGRLIARRRKDGSAEGDEALVLPFPAGGAQQAEAPAQPTPPAPVAGASRKAA